MPFSFSFFFLVLLARKSLRAIFFYNFCSPCEEEFESDFLLQFILFFLRR